MHRCDVPLILLLLLLKALLPSADPFDDMEMDVMKDDPKIRQPARNHVSCVVLTRLVLGGAWIGQFEGNDLLCPPQLPDVCFWILDKQSLSRDDALKYCSERGLTLWLPATSAEEIVMRLIMQKKNIARIPLRIRVIDQYTIDDMLDGSVSHDNFDRFRTFSKDNCFYFVLGQKHWDVAGCDEVNPVICSIY
ncbi:unnamed protein product [Dicrocoelium dendriticum]|nr:unnamed protein product [Dicrocoelium dendriticum]